jgi:hypothetical protein
MPASPKVKTSKPRRRDWKTGIYTRRMVINFSELEEAAILEESRDRGVPMTVVVRDAVDVVLGLTKGKIGP